MNYAKHIFQLKDLYFGEKFGENLLDSETD